DAIDLTVHAGEFVAVIGPSGSGKSTLMNILGCLDRPTDGTYRLDGVDVSEMSANQRAEIRNSRLGFVYQNFNLLSRTTALENVELPLIYGQAPLSSRQRRERAREIIRRVGLDGREKHTPAQLSGGQQQRVAIARALITDPPVILADEPTGNLDTRTSQEVMEIFERLNDEGKTVIIITHEHDIAAYAKRVVAFRDGKIVQDAPITERRRAQTVRP
ncbi:MAG: ABC transporter ATP-binding protein, partial [Acidobacteria bacterium]|nr:ABC transporter ATP-binding protein [Acidobacteriota bacterium]